jgi:repressor LexA
MRSILLSKGRVRKMGGPQTDFRQSVLNFVRGFMDEQGYPPTYDEIREAVGLSSKSHVDYYLGALEEEGLIERKPRTPRGLRLVGLAPRTFEVTLAGDIAAGEPLDLYMAAGEPAGPPIELTPDIADPRKELFALRVRGDSMIDDLVGEGDILICERQHQVRQGQMAVVLLRDQNAVTLKQVYPQGRQTRLQPAHPLLPPVYVESRQVEIQGRVVALIRRF